MKDNRRDFLKLAGLTGFGLAGKVAIPSFNSPRELPIEHFTEEVSKLLPLNRFPRMMQDYFMSKMRNIEAKSKKRQSALKTKSDAEAYVREVRSKIKKCFGPWPEKTPLHAKVTGILDRDIYKIEKVIFESRPGFKITANLYVPTNKKLPLPAVVGTCGHGDPGKATPIYQSFAQGLARQGYVVLIFDPIGQGERLQYLTKELKPFRGIGVSEHNYAGSQLILSGESLSTWFTWDCIRCVDYLLTRKEVDPKNIGVTGNSGGGTQATWLCGVEERLTMAAPSCFVVGFGRNLKNELPADIEQCPQAVLALGLDHSDFIAAMAPKPVMILDQQKDYFDVRGAEESFADLKNLYKLLGAEDNIQLFIGPEYHGYSQHNRVAMYGWFNKVTKNVNFKGEPDLIIEKEETLWCTPHGQVGATNQETVYSLSGQLSASLRKKRNPLAGEALKKAIVSVLKLPQTKGVPEYNILRPGTARLYPKKYAATYAVETEPGIYSIAYRLDDNVLLSRPPVGLKKALLYVSHHSADAELREEKFLAEIIRDEANAAIFSCDVRGIGESKPNTCGDNFLAPYGNDYFYAAHSLMLDYPYVGQKTYDVLRILDWIHSFGHEEIHVVAKGWGAIPATFATILSNHVSQVTLKNALSSYTDIAENVSYNWPLSTLLPGVLKEFDLPDCYRALAAKNLRQIEPWDAAGGKVG